MDILNVNGIRIGPIPQQSGAPTIQQAIYQAHDSVCGQNLLVYDRIGITNIRYIDLKNILDKFLLQPDTYEAFINLQIAGTTYLQEPSPENRLLYIQALTTWASNIFKLGDIPPQGYTYVITVYDSNGSTIYDSKTSNLTPTKELLNGTLVYSQVDLMTPNPFINTQTGTPRTSTNLYGIANNPGYLAYVKDADIQQSAFMVNQAAFPETVMAVASQLSDPANTRVFGFPTYGFAARQLNPNSDATNNFGSLGYFCSHLVNLFTIPNDTYPLSTLIETVFVRLGLQQTPKS